MTETLLYITEGVLRTMFQAKINIATLLVGMMGLGGASACASDLKEAENQVALGNALAAQGKISEAIGAYRKAIELRPDYAQAHNGLGTALRSQGKLVEAIAAYRKALELVPDYAEAHKNLAVTLRQAPGALMSEQPAWGKPLNGLRLGLYQTDPKGNGKPRLTVVLENVGTNDLVLILGQSWARGKKHHLGAMGLNLTTAEGMLKRSYDLRPKGSKRDDLADGAAAGPFVVQLVAGGRYTISSDLHDFYDPKDVDALLALGKYRVAAKFVGQDYLSGWKSKTDTGPRTWLDIMAYWTGTIQSDEIQVTVPANPAK
jgi:tetratricopeptide (TPR) repeat protein